MNKYAEFVQLCRNGHSIAILLVWHRCVAETISRVGCFAIRPSETPNLTIYSLKVISPDHLSTMTENSSPLITGRRRREDALHLGPRKKAYTLYNSHYLLLFD